jgi:hypothetical protein
VGQALQQGNMAPLRLLKRHGQTALLSDEAEHRRDHEVAHILADPFLTEIARVVDKLNDVQRALILRAVHDAATGYHRQEHVST